MTDITLQKVTNKQREHIRFMYLGNNELTDISAKLNIEIETVRFYVFGMSGTGVEKGCLYQEKKAMGSTAIAGYLLDKAQAFERVCGTALQILGKCLTDLYEEVNKGKELSVDEMGKLAVIVTSIDKLIRLESGLATETIEYKGLSRAEARQVLEDDPFANAIEVESVEVLPWLQPKQ